MPQETSASSGKRPVEELRASLPGQIADHQIIKIIGSGSYGDVVLARNVLTRVYRAIKIVWRNAFSDAKPYLREFDAIRRFEPISRKHPGLVQILQVGVLDSAFYYIMELADDCERPPGDPVDPDTYEPKCLSIQRNTPLPAHDCIWIGSQLADALEFLHRAHLIHRDVKPSNIIFVNGQPKLADIGMIVEIDEARSFVGTTGFVPPEGPTTPQADIYSLGKVLYEISTGKDRCEFPELPDSVSSEHTLVLEINQIVLKACQPSPFKRYSSAAEMAKELELLQAGKSIERMRELERRLKRLAAAAVIAALLIGVIFIVRSFRQSAKLQAKRRAGYLIAKGTDHMQEGNYAAALPFFLTAAQIDAEDLKNYQLRVGSVLTNAIRPASVWRGPHNGSFSADGAWLIFGVTNNLEIRDSLSGNILERHSFPEPVRFGRIAYSKELLAAVARSNVFVKSRRESTVRRFTFTNEILEAAFSEDGLRLAVSITNLLQIISLNTGKAQTITLPGHEVSGITFNSAHQLLLTTTYQGRSEVWDLGTLKPLSASFSQQMPYFGLFSPFNEEVVVTFAFDGAVPWNWKSGRQIGAKLEHEFGVVTAAFSPDKKILASGGLDQTVRLTDSTTFTRLERNHVLYHPERIDKIAFTDDQTLIVHCLDDANYIWKLSPSPPIAQICAWHPLPDRVQVSNQWVNIHAESNKVTGTIRGKELHLEFPNPIGALAADQLGSRLAIGTREKDYRHHAVIVYTPGVEQPLYSLKHFDGITFVAFSPSARLIATGSEDHTAMLWDSRTGEPITPPLRHGRQVHWVAFNSDETWVATASWDESVIIWDAKTGDPLTPPLRFGMWMDWVQFADSDSSIITGYSRDKLIKRMQLPIASLPLEKFKDALPAPASLVVKPRNF